MHSRFRATVPLAVGALIAGSLSVLTAAPAAAAPTTVYDSIPDTLPGNYISQPFQADQVDEFGDYVILGDGARVIDEVTIGFSSWACENDFEPADGGGWTALPDAPCATTTENASFEHPITVNLYDADNSGAYPEVGSLIESVTQDVVVPFRPSATPELCTDDPKRWYDPVADKCEGGVAFTATFDFSELDAVVADDVIVTVEFNTGTHGNAPIGAPGPYDSLNVGVNAGEPTIGQDENPGEFFVDSTRPSFYADGEDDGLDVLRASTNESGGEPWSNYPGLYLEITADDDLLDGPTEAVTVRQKDVKPTENEETYQEWHEGKDAPGYRVRENGLNLGVPTPSTLIKGTDVLESVVTEAELRRYIAKASVEVTQGTVTFQVPVHFSNEGDPTDGFTTLRSTSLGEGSHTFDLGDTWATTRVWGDYTTVHAEDELGDLISNLFDLYDTVWLAGFGVQADTLAVVPSLVWDDTTYTFQQPEYGECAAVTEGPIATNLDSSGWTFLDTLSEGHHEFTEDGLRLFTDSNGSQAKAAGYLPVDLPLADVGEPEIDWLGGGAVPGIQLTVDLDDDGVAEGNLVIEEAEAPYWWTRAPSWSGLDYDTSQGLTKPVPNRWYGTPDQWLTTYPDARVIRIGYSLGSGVLADGVLASITVGCEAYGFDYESPAGPTETERVWEGDIRPNEDSYPGWHEGYANAEQSYQVDQDGLHLGDPLHSQIINGLDEPLSDPDLEALITGAGVAVAEGSVTFQVPVFYGNGGEEDAPSFTTLRSLSLTSGEHEFSVVDRWVSSRALVDNEGVQVYPANQVLHLADLVDFLEAQGDVQLLAFGVQADTTATVTSITFDGTEYTFDGALEGDIPTISGATVVGETLSADAGNWAPSDVTLDYQWRSNGTPIEGATSSTFELTTEQYGGNITVAVTGSKEGYDSVTKISFAAGPVTGGPIVLVPPSISGTPQVDEVLTADPGDWTPEDLTFSYQWRADGAEIPGATGATFTPGADEVGADISVTVTATPTAGTAASATSAEVGPVATGVLTAPTPTITGSATTGSTLTAVPGTWAPAPVTLTYQWYAGATPIPGATSDTLVLSGAYVGDAIHVRVTGAKAGYASQTKVSTPTNAVVPGDVEVGRLSGSTRYDTAVEISQQFEAGVERVYLASGTGYADALSAGPVAAHDGAPLLLTAPNSLPTVVAEEIERLAPDEVIIVGGTGAVSAAVANQVANLDNEPDVIRIGGLNRYETSRNLIEFGFDDADTAYLATGSGFPDALAAGPAAAHFDGPVVLVPGSASSVDTATLALLTGLGVEEIRIAGGTGAVSAAIEAQLKAIYGASDVLRTSGANRYLTAVAINAAEFDVAPLAYLATGTGFADALAGVALAGRDGAPLFTAPGNCVPEPVIDALDDLGATTIVLLGGTGALSQDVADLKSCS